MGYRPTWELVLAVANQLTAAGKPEFGLAELIQEIQRIDPTRERSSIQPIVQGMTINAGKGPTAACGKILVRVEHGVYRLRRPGEADDQPVVRRTAEDDPRPPRSARRLATPERLRALTDDFATYVERYDRDVPFVRSGQYEHHRHTIDLRRELGSVESAVSSLTFCRSLHETLHAWGIGKRRSRLAPVLQFQRALIAALPELQALEDLHIEDPQLDRSTVTTQLDRLITELDVVDNKAHLVAGTKTLHHLLPDLVPPMDRAWTGLFFGWNTVDPQNRQTAIFTDAFTSLAGVAVATTPSRFVGEGWRTSASKVLDNALIGYCKSAGLEPPRA